MIWSRIPRKRYGSFKVGKRPTDYERKTWEDQGRAGANFAKSKRSKGGGGNSKNRTLGTAPWRQKTPDLKKKSWGLADGPVGHVILNWCEVAGEAWMRGKRGLGGWCRMME